MPWDIKSIAVLGSGAIGLYYGGRLAESGHNVSFLARSGLKELISNGLHANSINGDFHLPHPKVFQEPAEIGPVDLVIISWKATANHLLASTLPPILHSKTQVLTLQNGLGNCEQIAEIVDPENVCGGLCFVCINRTSPASIQHTAGGKLSIGEFATGKPNRAQTIANIFSNSKIPASAVPNLAAAQWEKLIWNIPFNGLAVAEGGVTTQDLLANPHIENEIRILMREILNAAHAQGIPLDESLIEKNIERTRPMGPYKPSTMIDFIEGREIELNPIWQEPLRRAKLVGSPMPALEKLIARMQSRIADRTIS